MMYTYGIGVRTVGGVVRELGSLLLLEGGQYCSTLFGCFKEHIITEHVDKIIAK